MKKLFSGILHYKSKEIHRIQRLLDPTIIIIIYFKIYQSFYILNFRWEILLHGFILFFLIYLSLNQFGIYKSFRQKSLWFLAQRITTGWAFSLSLIMMTSNILMFGIDFSGKQIVLWSFFSWLTLISTNLSLRLILKFHRVQGGNTKAVVYWGDYEAAKEFSKQIGRQKSLGMNLIAWFSPTKISNNISSNFSKKYGGSLEDMRIWLKTNKID